MTTPSPSDLLVPHLNLATHLYSLPREPTPSLRHFPLEYQSVNNMVKRAEDAKMRNFISKHLKAERRNKNNNNEQRLCGVDVVAYEIIDYQQKFAVLEFSKGVKLEASFVEFRRSQKQEAKMCFTATSQLGHEAILTPIFLTYNTEKKRILMFYERFNCLLADWSGGDENWWKKAACEQVQATRYLQDKGFIHLGLSDPKNFAIQHDKLKMLNITSTIHEYLHMHPGSGTEQIKRDNFKSLKDLIKPRYADKKALSTDDEAFFKLFDCDDLSYNTFVEKLINHPYAKDYRQCLWEFHKIHMWDYQKRLKVPLNETTSQVKFDPFRDWLNTIRSSNAKHLKKALPAGAGQGANPKYRKDDVDTLVYFIRNINEHRGTDRNKVDSYFKAVYKEIKKLFPGLLSMLHEEIERKKLHS